MDNAGYHGTPEVLEEMGSLNLYPIFNVINTVHHRYINSVVEKAIEVRAQVKPTKEYQEPL